MKQRLKGWTAELSDSRYVATAVTVWDTLTASKQKGEGMNCALFSYNSFSPTRVFFCV